MTQSKKIAVTGGIGSGKSAVCGILHRMGYPVFSCDGIAADLWREQPFLQTLAARFPDCLEGGIISREALTRKVFSDVSARRALNEISHPVIMERLMRAMEREKVAFGEVPLLFEGGYETLFDGVIALRRPLSARIASVMERDGCTQAEVEARMGAQLEASGLEQRPCYLLENDGDLETLERGVAAALRSFGVV